MAIPRLFNSNTQFIRVKSASLLSSLGEGNVPEVEENEDLLAQTVHPTLHLVMEQGTAKQVVTGAHDDSDQIPCVSIIAQAEGEASEEFSPTSTECVYSRYHLLKSQRSITKTNVPLSETDEENYPGVNCKVPRHRRIRRKLWRRALKVRQREEGQEPPVIRGLWVQEIDWSKSTNQDVSLSSHINQPTVELPRHSDLTQELRTVSKCVDGVSDIFYKRPGVPVSSSESVGGTDSPCSLNSISDSESIRTHESQSDSSCVFGDRGVSDSVCSLADVSDCLSSVMCVSDNFPAQHLRPNNFEYREGKDYHILCHIQNGSFGDVFSVQDTRTRFRCAAKKIPLNNFNCEEVSTWSALNSRGIVKLFGAVREGPYVTLFMDLKSGCLAQLLRERGQFPEEMALYYLFNVLGALEHLHHRNVLHLDVKVDNVLLSADGRDTFLCDFGLSETLDPNGQSSKAFRQSVWPAGTETHMAPEVARGDLRCAKADVWSSCCMLLHMLNGYHPWVRYYNHPLCFQIVDEPPPLREVPIGCNPYTADVFRAGLQKNPAHRASATELRLITNKALRAARSLGQSSADCQKQVNVKAGNYARADIPSSQPEATQSAPTMQWVSPWRVLAADADSSDSDGSGSKSESVSKSLVDSLESRDWESRQNSLEVSRRVLEDWESEINSEVDIYLGEDECPEESSVFKKGDWEFEDNWEEDESEWDNNPSTELSQALRTLFPVLRKSQPEKDQYLGSEPELDYLRNGVAMGMLAQTPSPEPRDQPPSCMSSTGSSHNETDQDSDRSSDDLSSGVFSYNSQTEGQISHLEWVALPTNLPPSNCFQGIEIWIENISGECLRIRERRQVKVGHVAIEISEQISVKTFCLETLDRKPISFSQEITESGFWLSCVMAPDSCPRWSWRIKDGKLEIRE
ncbi:hypothetical protein DPEC_G00329250 [Dallia pectoralis]|uniref:Uncharacterized protein n=1 Tax=Dallia pectoralis TaxID=75939 RepID=A0ACC2F8M3_DALPE|nr:hypothetical protein DPEC_G00329250 [Dallia pectoralis]